MKIHLHQKIFLSVLCLIFYNSKAYTQNIDFGKSYINVTKGLNGGTIETGDELEIRASVVVRSGVYDSCSYLDAVPAGTIYIPGTLAVLTNEGKIYKSFSDGMYNDEGWISGTNIRINLGFSQADWPATDYRRGRIRNTHKPSFYGSTCIMIASFRVRVSAPIGSQINMGGGGVTYRNASSSTNPVQTFSFPSNTVAVYTNIGMCPNLVGANSIGTEFNGTFGSGKPRNRGTSANVPAGYTFNVFNTNTPNDYYYGIANNTSTRVNYTTLNTWAKPDNSSPTHRVFNVWDIIGDHTGAADPLQGNPAADTVANSNAGYMLVVNAAYRIDSAFQQTITGLCPNTYYEISCWMRNICSKCGCDSNGKGATNTSLTPAPYIPTEIGPPGLADSSGVYPNITFEVNDIDYYTTGNMKYTGQWVKKGFTYRTGPLETSIVFKFKNNAPGGGGNDWALDDIQVATCYPNLTVNPDPFYTACADNLVNFGAVVRSFFNNYNQYKWQRSTDGGSSWQDAGVSGTAFPTQVNGQYEYTVNYPPFIGTMADSGHKYRVVVATTVPNLNSAGCNFASSSDFTTLNIINCTILPVELTSWKASLNNGQTRLSWTTEKETGPVRYILEKSTDGLHFSEIGSVEGKYREGPNNRYSFTDVAGSEKTLYYRLKLIDLNGRERYSSLITLNQVNLISSILPLDNPFTNKIRLKVEVPGEGTAQYQLTNMSGKAVRTGLFDFHAGAQEISISELEKLPAGVYLLRIAFENEMKNFKMLKY